MDFFCFLMLHLSIYFVSTIKYSIIYICIVCLFFPMFDFVQNTIVAHFLLKKIITIVAYTWFFYHTLRLNVMMFCSNYALSFSLAQDLSSPPVAAATTEAVKLTSIIKQLEESDTKWKKMLQVWPLPSVAIKHFHDLLYVNIYLGCCWS
jgi:hypothetical protein